MLILYSANGATVPGCAKALGKRCREEEFVLYLSLYFKTFFYQHL